MPRLRRLLFLLLLIGSWPLALADDPAEEAARLKRIQDEVARRRKLREEMAREGSTVTGTPVRSASPEELKRVADEIAKRRVVRLQAAGNNRIVIEPPARSGPPGGEKWSVVLRNETVEACGKLLARMTGKKVTINGRVAKKPVTLKMAGEKTSDVVRLFQPVLEQQGIALFDAGENG